MKRLLQLTLALIFSMALVSFVLPQEAVKPWDIPEKYQKMTNPHAEDASLVKTGKMIYAKHCKSCHGNKGLGNGPRAKQLDTFPGDFSSEAFKNTTDGDLYYKSIIGRDEMPNYEKKIVDEEDRWAVIMYIKTL